jgi:hypothetical protein
MSSCQKVDIAGMTTVSEPIANLCAGIAVKFIIFYTVSKFDTN